jgi:uncharacterized protein YheU (UPF0270 family)
LDGSLDLGGTAFTQNRATGLAASGGSPLKIDDSDADNNESAEGVIVPYTELSDEALRGLVESFVLREGTEYGEREFSLDQKVAQVLSQLRRGDAQIIFDPSSETVDIVVVRS